MRAGGPARRTVALLAIAGVAGLACLACLAAPAAPALGSATVVDERPAGPRTVELTINTGTLADETRVRVLFPKKYEAKPNRRYPVVYLLHAAFGNYRAWSDGIKIGSMTEDFPAIFVMPDGGKSGFYTDWFNEGAGGPPQWETYHVGELVPLIDGRYRTLADRSHRALIGGSMGGFGAFSYAARHPDMFGSATSISGAVDTNYFAADTIVTLAPAFELRPPQSVFGPRLTQAIRWRAHNPWDLADNLRGLDLQILSHTGLAGSNHPGFDATEYFVYNMSRSLHERLDALAVPHTWGDYGPGGHNFAAARVALVDALAHLRTALGSLPPPPKRFSHVAAEPHFAVYGWDFYADPGRALEFLQVTNASKRGVTLTGSGTETVTTAAYFKRKQPVDVTIGGVAQRLRADRQGRLTFSVELGAPHSYQQYTGPAVGAGQNAPGYFTQQTVTFGT